MSVTSFAGTERPPALAAAFAARDRALLRTARIEYAEQSIVTNADGQRIERPVHYYTWQCARDAYVSVDQGDEEGVVMRDTDGRPRNDLPYHGPMHYLIKDGEIWRHVEQALWADIFADRRADSLRLHDLRRLGLDPVTFGQDIEAGCREYGLPAPEYQTTIEHGLHVVTTTIGPGQIRWWIDPERGWNVVRTASISSGLETASMRFMVVETDGVWFPQGFEYVRLAADGREFTTVYTLLSTEFNRPDHPQELTPADIGVEPGMSLNYQDRSDIAEAVWDGHTRITGEEYIARVKDGSFKRGPTVEHELARWMQARERNPQPATNPSAEDAGPATRPASAAVREASKSFESEWEAYTRRFIKEYRLDAEQARKAWRICRNCEGLGRAYVQEHRAEFDEWQTRKDALAAAAADEQAKQKDTVDRRRADLLAPVQRIFEERLKPDLDKLPNDRQREARRPPTR
jgi:hypothetical protein